MTKVDKLSIGIMVVFGSWLFISCFWKSWSLNFFRVLLLLAGIQA